MLFAFFQQKTGNFRKNLAFWKQVCYIHTSVKNMTKEAVPCRFYGISPGDTLLILGNEASGLVVTRPEILNDLADEILGKEEHKT